MNKDNSEQKRLECLRDLEILDTDSEQCFDDITFLAATVCNMPIALISLVDEKRQWFKSKRGLDVCETTLDVAFCAHAIKEDNYLLVKSPLKDARFKYNPLVTDGIKIRFYLGIPLKTKCGHNIGTLCIIDNRPRELTEDQMQFMMRLARQSEHLLTLRAETLLHLKTKNNLKKSDEWSQMIFNNSSEMMGIVEVDAEKIWPLQMVNPAFCERIKVDVKNVIGRPVSQVISPTLLEKTLFMFQKVLTTKRSVEFESCSVDNNINSWFDSTISPKLNEEGNVTHLLIISRDITERKNQEAVIDQQKIAMAKNAKFSELGELAGSMAHEINNPLTIIISRAGKMKTMMARNEFNQEVFFKSINQINETAHRIAKIIRSLKTISRNADLDPMEPVNLKTIIEDTQFLCEERLRTSEIKLQLDYPEEISLELDARASQITQVLMNLINNSVHAISDLNEKWIKVTIALSGDGDSLIIKTTDSGKGIRLDIQNKMMEPFFTTKEFGKGTGLGLSISRGIIEAHDGKFYYDPISPNTSFVIELPRRQQKDVKKLA